MMPPEITPRDANPSEGPTGTAVPNAPRQPSPVSRVEVAVLAAGVLASIVIHGRYVIHGLGEPDAARLADQAVAWHNSGVPIISYAIRTSPLYLVCLKLLIDLGVTLTKIPGIMNWFSVITGGLTLVPMYFLWRRLANRTAAAIACVMFSATPAFWLGQIYGMPHVPSFCLFVLSLLLFSLAAERSGRSFALLAATAAVAAALSTLLKADILLCGAAYAGVAFCRKSLTGRNALLSLLIPAFALAVVLLAARLIVPSLERLDTFASDWSVRFPFTMNAIRDKENSAVPIQSVGKVLLYSIFVCLFYCEIRLKHLRVVTLALLWALPTLLFWSFKMGNSARHLMAAYGVMFLVVGLVIHRPNMPRWMAPVVWAQVFALLYLNYTSTTSELPFSSVLPDTRLLQITPRLQRQVTWFHNRGKGFVRLKATKKLYYGSGSHPYVQWEVFTRAASFAFEPGRTITDPWDTLVTRPDGAVDTVRTVYLWSMPYEIKRSERWTVNTAEPRLTRLIKYK